MEIKQVIKMYLDVNAMQDAEFKAKYSNPSKNIDECILYIQSEMLKQALEGKDKKDVHAACVMPSDDEVFALAVRYYMDDDLKVDGSAFDNVKVLSRSATTFTDEEKSEMRQEAIRNYQNDVIAEQKKKDAERKAKKAKKPTSPVLVPNTPATTSEEPTNKDTKAEQKPKAVQFDLFGDF